MAWRASRHHALGDPVKTPAEGRRCGTGCCRPGCWCLRRTWTTRRWPAAARSCCTPTPAGCTACSPPTARARPRRRCPGSAARTTAWRSAAARRPWRCHRPCSASAQANLHFLDLPDGGLAARRARSRRRRSPRPSRPLRPGLRAGALPLRRAPRPRGPQSRRARGAARAGRRCRRCSSTSCTTACRFVPGGDVRRALAGRTRCSRSTPAPFGGRQARRAGLLPPARSTLAYPWQDRPILTEDSLRRRCEEPELFLPSDPAAPLDADFAAHARRVSGSRRSRCGSASRPRTAPRPSCGGPSGDEGVRMTAGGERLRVVVFTGGAVLEHDCAQFVLRIDAHPELELAGVFCQARETGPGGVAKDLLRRRGALAPLLLAQRGLRRLGRALAAPRRTLHNRRRLNDPRRAHPLRPGPARAGRAGRSRRLAAGPGGGLRRAHPEARVVRHPGARHARDPPRPPAPLPGQEDHLLGDVPRRADRRRRHPADRHGPGSR
jgi:hypothetical protein